MSTATTVKNELQNCITRLNKYTNKNATTLKEAIDNLYGFTEIPYIEFSGAQYIDTEVLTSQNLKIECEFSTATKQKLLLGARGTNADALCWGYYNSSPASYFAFGGTASSNSLTLNVLDGQKHKLVMSNQEYSIDNEEQSCADRNRGELTSFYSIALGTWNNAGSYDSRYYEGKIYSLKMWRGNELIRDFIPVLNNETQVICLFDKVECKFYYNKGSGNFVYEEEE